MSGLGSSLKMYYKMQHEYLELEWCINKSYTFWILDSINMVRSIIAITNIFYKIWDTHILIKNYSVIQLRIRYNW